MLFIQIFRAFLILFVLYVFVTQIMIPWIRGTKLFPVFRKEGNLRRKVTDQKQKTVEDYLEQVTNPPASTEGEEKCQSAPDQEKSQEKSS